MPALADERRAGAAMPAFVQSSTILITAPNRTYSALIAGVGELHLRVPSTSCCAAKGPHLIADDGLDRVAPGENWAQPGAIHVEPDRRRAPDKQAALRIGRDGAGEGVSPPVSHPISQRSYPSSQLHVRGSSQNGEGNRL